tara:strand:- start:400 stop:516 length:117 start_codon:yes stop_codon:yes gene_type:complete
MDEGGEEDCRFVGSPHPAKNEPTEININIQGTDKSVLI